MNKGRKERENFNLPLKKWGGKKEEELTDEVPRLASQPLRLRARGQGRRKISLLREKTQFPIFSISKFPNFQKRVGERCRCWEKKFNFQGALFLCSGSVTLFKFAPLCCLFARNSVSLLCKSTSRSPLKAKESWTVWSVNTDTLASTRKFVYFAKYRDTCCFRVKIRVFCLGHKNKSILWLPEQWSRGISSDDNRTPKGCHLCAVSEEVSVNLLQFCLQECYKKQKLQINPSSKQMGYNFWNISYVDVSLVGSKMCTFLKTLLK